MPLALSTDFTEFVFGARVPPTAQSVTLSIRIVPRTGTLAIYSSPNDSQPLVQCKGPSQQVTIGYGAGNIFVKALVGTIDFEITILSWGE